MRYATFKTLTAAKCGLLAGIAVIAAPVMAQDSKPAGPAAADATDKASGINEIVVTAGKRTERLAEVGGAISAISGDMLRNLNANKLQDYLGFVPGVTLTSYGRPGQNQLSIRGISSQSVGPATAVYIDEVPFGQSSNEAQGSAYTPDLDPSDLERVEVLKGPQGTLYGASSLGGLLKYVTRNPSLTQTSAETGQEVEAIDHGSIGYKFRASGTTPLIKDVLGIRLSGYYRQDGGYVDNTLLGQKNVNKGDAYGGRASLLYTPFAELRIKLGALLQNTSGKSMDEVDYTLSTTTPTTFTPTYGDLNNRRYINQPNHYRNRLYSAEINYDFGPVNLVSASGLSRQGIDRVLDVTQTYGVRYNRYLHTVPGDGNTIPLDAEYHVRKFTQEVRLQSRQNGKFEWVVGGFYQNEDSDTLAQGFVINSAGQVLAAPIGNPINSSSYNRLHEYAGFANATYYIVPSFDITAGYRHSRINQDNDKYTWGLLYTPTTPALVTARTDIAHDNVNTYSIAARWRITHDVMVYARAASGFRPGGGRSLPPAAQAVGLAPTYKPDTVWSYETGVKAKTWDNKLSFDIDGFWIDWKDIQNLQLVDAFLVQGNAGKARSRGIEATVELVPVPGLDLTGTFAFTDAEYTEANAAAGVNKGDPLTAVAKYTASLRGEYQLPMGTQIHPVIGGDFRYRSRQEDQVGVHLPGYTTYNLHAGITDGRYQLNVFANNLTDKRGILGTTTGATSYAVVQPRTIGVSFSQKW